MICFASCSISAFLLPSIPQLPFISEGKTNKQKIIQLRCEYHKHSFHPFFFFFLKKMSSCFVVFFLINICKIERTGERETTLYFLADLAGNFQKNLQKQFSCIKKYHYRCYAVLWKIFLTSHTWSQRS